MTAFKEKLIKNLAKHHDLRNPYRRIFYGKCNMKKAKRWSYPLIIVGTIIMFLLIIEIGPLGQIEQTQHASIVQLAQQQSIKNIQ